LNPLVIFVETGKVQAPELTSALEASGFQVLPCGSIFDLEELCREDNPGVVILNLDDPLMNNRVLKEMKRKRPGLKIIGISGRPFHPELKEAMASQIYACLCEPLDPDELIYLVKSIFSTATSYE
jgi:DNA-binding NtrC family response regulator